MLLSRGGQTVRRHRFAKTPQLSRPEGVSAPDLVIRPTILLTFALDGAIGFSRGRPCASGVKHCPPLSNPRFFRMHTDCRRTKQGLPCGASNRRLRIRFASLLLLGACGAALCGCRSLSRNQGPVPPAVATARQLTQQGMNAMERGDWKRAESLLARAVQTCPNDADARRNYAETLWHRDALSDALLQMTEARRLASEDPALAVRTGELYLALGRISDARGLVHEALQWDPKFAPGWTLRGRVASAAGQFREALADYQRSLAYAPDNHEAAILVAEVYRQLNEPERALLALRSVADNYSPHDEPQQLLYLEGLALTALGRYDEAVRSLTQAAQRDRPTAEILCRLAEAELLAGRTGAAQAWLQEALALDPNHAASRTLSTRIALAAPTARTIMR